MGGTGLTGGHGQISPIGGTGLIGGHGQISPIGGTGLIGGQHVGANGGPGGRFVPGHVQGLRGSQT